MKKQLFIIFTITSTLFSENYKILDENKIPIENAQIYTDSYGTISDSNGFFNIGNNCINYKISHIGFQDAIFNPCESNKIITLKNISIPNDEIKVIGDLNKDKLKNLLTNIEVFTKTNILNSNKTSLKNILQSATNVNYSGPGSRIRYFQIRGIGEYEQYVSQGGPSYYVATYIDNFNYSGLGMPVFMYDVEQVEIFKGAQSFAFGQNAMAGLIKIILTKPKPLKETKFMAEIGSFNKLNLNLVHNQPMDNNVNLRFGFSKNTDQGFIFNTFTNEYSNKRDEFIINLQFSIIDTLDSGDFLKLNLNSLSSNLDNNYDRWSYNNFNNMQDFYTHSNFEGLPNNESKDALVGQSNSLEMTYQKKQSFKITSILSFNDIELDHFYDSDWSNPNQWEADHPGIDYYSYAQQENRNRKDKSLEIKLSNSIKNHDFLLGLFRKSLNEKDTANGFVFWTDEGWVSNFTSRYFIDYLSYYLQHKINLNSKSYLIFNLRTDGYKNTYSNNLQTTNSSDYSIEQYENNHSFSENFYSSRIGLKINKFYFSISSAHKPGGFNQNPFIDDSYRKYSAEKTQSIELGYKNIFNKLRIDLNLFYMNRNNLQADIADQADPENPVTFYFYTANIENGFNSGMDLSLNYNLSKKINLFLNCGLLRTGKDAFSYPSPIFGQVPIEEREQARSPKYTLSSGFEVQLTKKIFTRFELSQKDKYYYFNNTDQMARKHTLMNITSRYKINEKLNINLSIKNITDERYGIHGFYFSVSGYATEGRKFHETPANPRDISLSVNYSF